MQICIYELGCIIPQWVRASYMDQWRRWRFAARVLQRPGHTSRHVALGSYDML